MALIRIDHVPESVGVNLPLYVIVPQPGQMGDVPVAGRKVLYLLHGLSDDGSAWQRYTSIETVAGAYGLVVVMPSAGRSFYTDQPNGQKYFTYLTEELPRYLADLFDLRPQREDTFIAGNSMGGYGAIKAALLHPELYAAAASFSGVLSLEVLRVLPATDPRKPEFELLFGGLENLAGGQHDPAAWLARAAQDLNHFDGETGAGRPRPPKGVLRDRPYEPGRVPRLFLYVGRQEDIYPLSGMFHAACRSAGVASAYHEEDGSHDWFLWDRQIRLFLASVLGPMPT